MGKQIQSLLTMSYETRVHFGINTEEMMILKKLVLYKYITRQQ